MHILIVRNNYNPKATDASLLLMTYLSSQGIDFTVIDVSSLEGMCSQTRATGMKAPDGVGLAVALGGDGTILRTARLLCSSDAPLLGINFGHLGFLPNASDDGVVAIVAEALAGDVVRDLRANMQVNVILEGDRDPFEEDGIGEDDPESAPDPLDGRDSSFFALNEIAITRGTMGRMIDFSFSVSDAHVADMRGDGMVVSTATGSTAYALSAGGPLVAPSFMGLVIVPLAPHTIQSRALLTGENDIVRIDLAENFSTREATLFIDGDLASFDRPVRRLYIRRGERPTVLLRGKGCNFYERISSTFF